MKRTKIAIIGTAGIPANYGGFETLAEHLVEELGTEADLSVYCTTKRYTRDKRQKSYKGARLIYLPFNANGIQSILYDFLSILHAIFYADVLLVLGVSGGMLLPLVRWFTSKKIITSIDGIEWKRNKWQKHIRWFLWASEWIAVRCSHANIADNESIQDYTAMRYGSLSNIIEYGANHVQAVQPGKEDFAAWPFLSRPYAIKVCRIEPENNIGMVLEAFSRLDVHNLVIVGNWNNSTYGRELRVQYQDRRNIFLLDPIYDQRKIDLLRSNATVYIHGHSAGGTNPSLVEAMYLGLPVIAFNVMYNKTTTEQRALYFKDADELERLIRKEKMRDLRALGATMKQIADRRYTWSIIAGKYRHLIEALTKNSFHHALRPAVSNYFTSEILVRYQIGHLQSPSLFYEKR